MLKWSVELKLGPMPVAKMTDKETVDFVKGAVLARLRCALFSPHLSLSAQRWAKAKLDETKSLLSWSEEVGLK